MENTKPKLMLLFTRGVSLQVWDSIGMLEREIELYRRLLPHLSRISFLTYGDDSELRYQPLLDGIKIIPNSRRLTPTRFSIVAPFLFRKEFRDADIVKTNQLDGAWTGVIAKLFFRKKLIVRCGYLRSFTYQKLFGDNWHTHWAFLLEKLSFKLADACIVSASSHSTYLSKVHKIPERKVLVVPNAIDTKIFCPLPTVEREKGLVCYVGRLAPEKNLDLLFDAAAGLPGIKLLIIGNGPLRAMLERKATDNKLDVEFHSRMPNHELPQFLNRACMYAQPSSYEGCPKTLLEAMSCGLPVIGTDVEGISDIICHRENGVLCDKSVQGIRDAILSMLGDDTMAEHMGKKARQYVTEYHSIDRIVQKELEIIRMLYGQQKSEIER
ncbi:glycosyltransferase family 4 protein [Candidatus Poribacteria bacterium]|nr:glycosyltransferase family 4 protein [Candidatus Poribacteria bacterium]